MSGCSRPVVEARGILVDKFSGPSIGLFCLTFSITDPNISANFKRSPGHLEAEGTTIETGENDAFGEFRD